MALAQENFALFQMQGIDMVMVYLGLVLLLTPWDWDNFWEISPLPQWQESYNVWINFVELFPFSCIIYHIAYNPT